MVTSNGNKCTVLDKISRIHAEIVQGDMVMAQVVLDRSLYLELKASSGVTTKVAQSSSSIQSLNQILKKMK